MSDDTPDKRDVTNGRSPSEELQITSEGLSRSAVVACWAFSMILIGAGITATFTVEGGAAAASMILLGTLLLILALMQRIPLRIEVGGAKFDASYPLSQAFNAGREAGVAGAIAEVEEASEVGQPAEEALQRLRGIYLLDTDALMHVAGSDWVTPELVTRLSHDPGPPSAARSDGKPGARGYPSPVACKAAGVTFRQLDYWARTGLITPSVRLESTDTFRWLFSEFDIVQLRMVRRLLDAGVSLRQIRVAIKRIRETGEQVASRITLLSDGVSVYEATTRDEVLDLMSSGRGVFGISVAGVTREVEAALVEPPAVDEPPPGLD